MNIHEYQGKQILGRFGVRVPKGRLIEEGPDPLDLPNLKARGEKAAQEIAMETGCSLWVVKAQIHAGGRGKAGGIKLCRSGAEVGKAVEELIGKILVTKQTGPEGKRVHKVWVEQASNIARELYFAILLDRAVSEIILMASTEGGVDIEEVAASSPEKIVKIPIDPGIAYQSFHGRKLSKALGFSPDQTKDAVRFFKGIYQCMMDLDCSMIEINPLILTRENTLVVLDSKISFDENGLFRHPEILELRDLKEENPQDVEASKFDLAYIALDGNIGCLVNGAGLAMATMDIIKLHGGAPANFLDVGGGASKEKVTHAFKIILKDPKVKAILVNIFGGIMKCDIIAEGIIAAAKELKLSVPLVVRLEGTHVEKGKEILAQSGLKIIPADGLTDAAKKVVAASRYT